MSSEREPAVLGAKKPDASTEEADSRADTVLDEARSETLLAPEEPTEDRADTVADPSTPEFRTSSEADERPTARDTERDSSMRSSVQGPVYHVAGFWRRTGGGLIDLAAILPVSWILGWISGAVSGIHLPPSRHRGIDFWVDLILANDPAFMGWLGLTLAVGCIYLMVFQVTMGRTLGMRATKTRIIDIYGAPPTTQRAARRTAGYLACLATLGLGFVWAGFDAEKRGLHDWIAGTYVVRD